MQGYGQVNLNNMLNAIGEDRTKSILSDFCCPYNNDVEIFLKLKAIEFSKQGISATHLVFTSYQKKPVLIGYFTLSPKIITVKKDVLSRSKQKQLAKFATYNQEIKAYSLPAPLIGQLSKNFNHSYNQLITGDELLKMACDKVKATQLNIGGRYLYVECENTNFLKDFYRSNGFFEFGERALDADETGLAGSTLIQLLKYLR